MHELGVRIGWGAPRVGDVEVSIVELAGGFVVQSKVVLSENGFVVGKVVFNGARGYRVWLDDGRREDLIWGSDGKSDGLRLVEGVMFSKLRRFFQWHLDELEPVTLDRARPSRDRLSNQLGRRSQPLKLNVIAVLGIVDSV